MSGQKALFGHREFFPPQEIAKFIVRSKNFDANKERVDQADTFLFFSTSEQHTWLVATPHRLYCILDDVRKIEPHINWSMSRRKLFDGNDLTIDISARDRPGKAGLVDFGTKHRNWFYSKMLFTDEPIEDAVRRFVLNSMSG